MFGLVYAGGKEEDYKKLKPYLKRHEADEARYLKNIEKKHGSKGVGVIGFVNKTENVSGKIKQAFSQKLDPSDYEEKLVGQHVSPKVLKNEYRYSNFAKSMYNDTDRLIKLRSMTGEREKIQQLADKYIKKIEKAAVKLRMSNISKLEKEYQQFKILNSRKFLRLLLGWFKHKISVQNARMILKLM